MVERVGEGVEDLEPRDHVLPVFTRECKECQHCLLEEHNIMSKFREYIIIYSGCLAKIDHVAPLDKVCILSCGISRGPNDLSICSRSKD
ncbi:hypothetical protein MLD38_021697 [Melastoma candidum]|uniref:Uncharacterized protein n=1 Tax=Melastoma candidum TaxID=119954 RepID=A0ACB9QHT5_9MYRT|nr:hypothetical protein MLD38_021697 [Melastoma candidum]